MSDSLKEVTKLRDFLASTIFYTLALSLGAVFVFWMGGNTIKQVFDLNAESEDPVPACSQERVASLQAATTACIEGPRGTEHCIKIAQRAICAQPTPIQGTTTDENIPSRNPGARAHPSTSLFGRSAGQLWEEYTRRTDQAGNPAGPSREGRLSDQGRASVSSWCRHHATTPGCRQRAQAAGQP